MSIPEDFDVGDEVRVVIEGEVQELLGRPIFERDRVRITSPAMTHAVSFDPDEASIETIDDDEYVDPHGGKPAAEALGPGR